MDNAYQCLFNTCLDTISDYSKCSETDIAGGVAEMNPRIVEKDLLTYKQKYESTGQTVHVSVACELYDNVKSSVNRGYRFDSWLRDERSCLYFGDSPDNCNGCVLRLDKIFAMLEYMKRSSEKYRDSAAVLRHSFMCNLYKVFIETQKIAKNGEVNEVLESRLAQLIEDIPIVKAKAPASFMSGDIMNVIKSGLPEVKKLLSEAAKSMGGEEGGQESKAIGDAMGNITGMLENPEKLMGMISDFGSGKENFASLFKKMLPPGAMEQMMGSAAAASASGPTPPRIDGPSQD